MPGTYTPAALFGPTSSIGRKQYLVSFFYQILAADSAAQIQSMTHGQSGAAAFALGTIAFFLGIGAFALMVLAIKARLSDCEMSLRWLALPLGFLALDVLRSSTGLSDFFVAGITSLLSLAGLMFVIKISVVALLLLLMLVPSAPGRHIQIGTAR
jgi:hypothetical protein